MFRHHPRVYWHRFRNSWLRWYGMEMGGLTPDGKAVTVRLTIRRWHPWFWWQVVKQLRHVRIEIERVRR